jgi:hypothetical protein
MTNRHYGLGDNAFTTLNGAINNSVGSLVVASAASFAGLELPFVITVADDITDLNMEKMVVTAVAGTTFTVTRAFQSTAVAHGSGSTVSVRVVAQHVKDLQDVAVQLIQSTAYVEHTFNGSAQITQSVVWETSAKLVKLGQVTYTYPNISVKLPSSATRVVYQGDGTTVRRTETVTFTYSQDTVTVMERVIS